VVPFDLLRISVPETIDRAPVLFRLLQWITPPAPLKGGERLDHPQPPQGGLPPPIPESRQIGTRGHESAQVDVTPWVTPPQADPIPVE